MGAQSSGIGLNITEESGSLVTDGRIMIIYVQAVTNRGQHFYGDNSGRFYDRVSIFCNCNNS
ncbi:hypothetical protein L3i20_v230600 [Paenibacillus sp. L3-i20]|nr:hypothetical protein L3i20_v230600 [Paenibacillus sp. L3-i20]